MTGEDSIEPMQRTPVALARRDGLTFPVGAWDPRLDVLINYFDSLSFQGRLAEP